MDERMIFQVCCPTPCVTPDQQTGECINIYKCEVLANKLRPPVVKQNMDFVINSKWILTLITSKPILFINNVQTTFPVHIKFGFKVSDVVEKVIGFFF